jgi:hypothetical protein
MTVVLALDWDIDIVGVENIGRTEGLDPGLLIRSSKGQKSWKF